MRKLLRKLASAGLMATGPRGEAVVRRWQLRDCKSFDNLIIGPWLGEVGPEFVYWVPFLNGLKKSGWFEGKRVIAVSRGGPVAAYASLGVEYVDAFDVLAIDQFKKVRGERPTEKQRRWTPGERGLVRLVAEKLQLKSWGSVHPGAMWEELGEWLASRRSLDWLKQKLIFSTYPAAPHEQNSLIDSWELPSRFQFAKFYSSPLFPNNAENQRFITNLVRAASLSMPIVTMGVDQSGDGHSHIGMPGVIDLSPKMGTRDNLGLQIEVMRRSSGFFGTYGGFSALSAFVGCGSVSFYSETLKKCGFDDIHFRHEAITTEIFRQLGQPYQVLNINGWGKALGLTSAAPH